MIRNTEKTVNQNRSPSEQIERDPITKFDLIKRMCVPVKQKVHT